MWSIIFCLLLLSFYHAALSPLAQMSRESTASLMGYPTPALAPPRSGAASVRQGCSRCRRCARCNLSFRVAHQGSVVIAFFELRVLGFGLSIDQDIRIGIFPKVEECFVGFAGGCVIAHQSLCPTELKPGQWTGDKPPAQTGIVDQLLELARGRSAIA